MTPPEPSLPAGGRRPPAAVFLCIILLGQSLFNLLGAWAAYERLGFLGQRPLALAPAYFVARDAVWAVGLAVLAAAVWRQQAWARRWAALALLLYACHGWVDRWGWAAADYARAATGWLVACDLVWVGVAAGLAWRWGRGLARRPS